MSSPRSTREPVPNSENRFPPELMLSEQILNHIIKNSNTIACYDSQNRTFTTRLHEKDYNLQRIRLPLAIS